jgi:hypothetical protein
LKVKAVTITDAVTAGTVKTTDGATANTTWTPTTSSTDNLVFGDVVTTLAPQAKDSALYEKLLIPTKTTEKASYQVTFSVELLQGGVNSTDQLSIDTYAVKASINDQEFKPGYAYNIKATLTADNVNPSGDALEPIVFSVKEIADWTPENGKDLNVPEKKAEE